MRANSRMDAYLEALARIDPPSHIDLTAPFNRLLKKGLVKQGRTITFGYFSKSAANSRPPALPPSQNDPTGYEHARNRLHVEDFVRRGRERYPLTLLRHSMALALVVFERVATLAPSAKVQVTVSFDRNVRQGICVFSFHLRRKGQELWPDIEAFQEACLVIDGTLEQP